jgi:hypothetical protein
MMHAHKWVMSEGNGSCYLSKVVHRENASVYITHNPSTLGSPTIPGDSVMTQYDYVALEYIIRHDNKQFSANRPRSSAAESLCTC